MIKNEDFRKRLIQNQDFVCKHILRDEKNINEISLLWKNHKIKTKFELNLNSLKKIQINRIYR